MNLLGKMFRLVFRLILPTKVYSSLADKISRTKAALNCTKELKTFWKILKIVLLPISFLLSFLVAIVKTVFIWVLPQKVYSDFRYILKMFYLDITQRKLGLKLAWKRVLLCYELFTKGAEKRVSYGEKNPDITFYVVRPYYFVSPNELLTHPQHLLFYYYLVLHKISNAINNGWVPIVDFENYEGLLYFAEEKPIHGTKNAWEYFWEQPSTYTLKEVYQSKNVILSTRNAVDYKWIPPTVIKHPFQKYATELTARCPRYARLIPFNTPTRQYIDDWQAKLFPEGSRVLGVIYRSTSYGSEATPNKSHPVQPSLISLSKKARDLLKKYDMEYIYFVNEEEKNVQYMRDEFGERLIILPRKRYEDYHQFSPEDPNPLYVLGQRYPTNLSYLTEIALLSRCTGLVGAMSSGTRAALIWNQGLYEVTEIIDLGLW